MSDIQDRVKFDEFLETVKNDSKTEKLMRSKFDINRGTSHADSRGQDPDQSTEDRIIRENIGAREIATIIQQGKLQYKNCRVKGPMTEIAIDACFKRFEAFDWKTETSRCFPEIFVRLIVREINGRKHVIVTFYKLRPEKIDYSVGEVDLNETWR